MRSSRRLGILLLFGLLVVILFQIRFWDRWIEQDTGEFIAVTRGIVETGRYDGGPLVYPLGSGFQTVTASLIITTGIPERSLFLTVLPFVGILFPFTGYAVAKRIGGGEAAAALTFILLLLHPDILFAIIRGNHEKMTFLLMALSILFMVLLLRAPSASRVATLVIVIVGLSTMNLFYAISFAIVLFLAGGLATSIAKKFGVPISAKPHRVWSVGLLTLSVSYLLMFFIYRPAAHLMATAGNLLGQIRLLFLNIQPTTSPYAAIELQWISTEVWIVTNLLTWVVLTLSAIVTVDWLLWNRLGLLDDSPGAKTFLAALHIAFTVQFVIAAVIDLSGFLAANLQLRVFPPLILTAVIITSLLIARVVRYSTSRTRRKRAGEVVLTLALVTFLLLGLLRMTSDPLISQKWIFYDATEETAVVWINGHMAYEMIWSGFDERIRTLDESFYGGTNTDSNFYQIDGDTRRSTAVFSSEIIQTQAGVTGQRLPLLLTHSLVYNSGGVSIYRPLAETPYQ